MFANPMVGHWVSAAHKLPILTIIFNNSRYGAVRRATLSMFKDGVAGENDGRMLADLDPAPPYEEMAQAQGAHAERVEKPADLPDALARARDAVVNERPPGAAQRHHALLESTNEKTSRRIVMRIDAYTHFIPEKFFNKMVESGHAGHRQAHARNPLASTISTRRKKWSTVPGLCADPLLSDAADRSAGQGRRADRRLLQADQ